MPRLTTKQYLRTHDRLRRLWLKDPAVFAELSPTEQWQLHDYFKPAKGWTDLQQAGRALAHLWNKAAVVALKRVRGTKVPVAAPKRVRQQDRHLVVRAVVRPEIDAKKLARAFIHLARDLERRRSKEGHDGRSRP